MPVIGTALNIEDDELQEFVDCIRLVMRDKAPNNHLLDDVQFEDSEIERAIKLAVSDYNATPPETSVEWRDIPEALLFLGSASYLMLSESFLQVRNQVSVPVDNLGVIGIDDKYQAYNQLRGLLKSEFEAKIRAIKSSRNMESAYGSLQSGYSGVSRFSNN